jgi:uncharacterized repeat protein (TIGR02059 family)
VRSVPTYRGLKPPPGVRINPGHPLARDLRGFWLLNDLGQVVAEYVRGYPSVLKTGNALAWSPTQRGLGVLLDASNPIRTNPGASDAADAFTQPTYPLTIAGCCRPDSTAVVNCLYATQANGAGSNYVGARLTIESGGTIASLVGNNTGIGSSNRRSKTSTATVPGANKLTTIGASIRSNTDISLYVDGKDAAGSTSGTGGGLAYNATNAGAVGAIANNAPGFTGAVVWVGLWARSLSAEEHMQLLIDPFAMFTTSRAISPFFPIVTLPFIASATSVFAPTVTPSGAVSVAVPFIASATSVFAPTIESEAIDAPFIAATTTVYAPTVVPSGAATVALPFIAPSTTVYPPTLVHLDTTPPQLKLIGAYRSKVTLVYDEALDPATPDISEFAVTVNGLSNTVTAVSVAGSTVTIALTTPIVAGDRVKVSYSG